ncbi:MAG TPA: C4-dicarboxylate ABC transporter, partial [Oceanospirillaceae bacterium]|nr:C4-dicarboxylate ABC transporter [Oceanospirillaceae bacterium]
MKLIKSAVAATAVALAATSLSTVVMAEEKILLKTPVAFPSSLPALGSPIINITDTINMLGGGTLKMKFYEPKKLVATSEILDAVSSGKVNAGYTTAGYHAGKMPASPIFSAVPFGPEAGEYLAWML